MSSAKNDHINTAILWKNFASQATTHGLRRISETEKPFGKLCWTVIFLIALAGCTYHCSFLIQKYLNFGKVTTTEEIHAKELDFPALTVCNLNILKKRFIVDQMEKNKNSTFERKKGFCFESEETFLEKSDAKDLSDIWSNLGITLPHLQTYGHKVYDLIVQCTYNSKDCFNQSITDTLPLITENLTITDYPSTRLGYCHTIKLNQSTLGKVRRTGQTLGMTLTLNIERNLYWNLLSPEYGVRIMVHPRQAYPTVDRGGIVLHPGTKTYISIRIREIERLPAPFGDCTTSFIDSPLSELLRDDKTDEDFLKNHTYYTYEFCQSLCRELHLRKKCGCVEEQVNSSHKFCNPCDQREEDCKEDFKRDFDDDEKNACTYLCKPACQDTRYDVTLSTSEWPNIEFQEFVLKRWPDLRNDFLETNATSQQLNETFLNKNFLRVHVFIQEMNYLRFKDIEAYSLPELFADLGGCLGLYIGVSLISIIEFQELLLHIFALFYEKLNRSFYIDSGSLRKRIDSRTRSRSVDDLMRGQNKVYAAHFRPEGPTPPVLWVRGRKGHKNTPVFKISGVECLADEEMFPKKICYKCFSDIENLRSSSIHRRHLKTVIRPPTKKSMP